MQGLGNQAVWLAASDEYYMQSQTLIFGAGFGGDLAYASPSFLPYLSTTTNKGAKSLACQELSLREPLAGRSSGGSGGWKWWVEVVVEIAMTTGNRTQALLTTWLIETLDHLTT